MVVATRSKRVPPKEAKRAIDAIWDEVLQHHMQAVWAHRLTRELKAGTVPMEVIKGYAIHQWHWALETNNTLPFIYNADRSFFRRQTDLEPLVFDKVSDEFGTPGPGGHQRMVDEFIFACGFTREEAARLKCLPEMRGWIDSITMGDMFGSYGQNIFVVEDWIPPWREVWVESLTTHYGFSRESLIYFVSHMEADAQDHQGGEAIGHEVMSHSHGNKYLAQRALEEGYAPENYETVWRERGKGVVNGWLMWFDALYDHYDPRSKA